jgi:trimeric autotransporter adhesin
MIHIRTAAGVELATFKPKNGVYYFHFSNPGIASSTSHQVYFGGSYTGGSFVGNSTGWGLYTGGTYSTTGGTLKSTFTTSGTATINTVTF